ncbi:hypothetical protein BJV78DRAFT_565845 [Lactifluus subvellereus]|nr:hypothetical protein BJV78DRAFT_565845 [Lactifluus subvellereus]
MNVQIEISGMQTGKPRRSVTVVRCHVSDYTSLHPALSLPGSFPGSLAPSHSSRTLLLPFSLAPWLHPSCSLTPLPPLLSSHSLARSHPLRAPSRSPSHPLFTRPGLLPPSLSHTLSLSRTLPLCSLMLPLAHPCTPSLALARSDFLSRSLISFAPLPHSLENPLLADALLLSCVDRIKFGQGKWPDDLLDALQTQKLRAFSPDRHYEGSSIVDFIYGRCRP